MGQQFDIPFPVNGISDDRSFSEQAPGPTRAAQNVRGLDPKTGRERGGQRSGLTKYNAAQVNGANKIMDMISVTYDQKNVDYANIANAALITHALAVSRTPMISVDGISPM